MNQMKRTTLAAFTAGSIAILSSISAMAVQLSFFGQDVGPGESYPGLSSWPNSSAAEANFLVNLSGVGTETFESKTPWFAPGVLVFPGAGTATMTGDATVVAGHSGAGRYPISGTNWVETSTNLAIDFDSPMAAFGFYGIDMGDFGGNLILHFIDGTTMDFTLGTAGMAGGSVMYFGYINDQNLFNRVEFGNSASGTDFFGFDDMTIGSVEMVIPPIPDAGTTFGLLGLALVGLAAANRKLRNA
jgi:hypothetical protein